MNQTFIKSVGSREISAFLVFMSGGWDGSLLWAVPHPVPRSNLSSSTVFISKSIKKAKSSSHKHPPRHKHKQTHQAKGRNTELFLLTRSTSGWHNKPWDIRVIPHFQTARAWRGLQTDQALAGSQPCSSSRLQTLLWRLPEKLWAYPAPPVICLYPRRNRSNGSRSFL